MMTDPVADYLTRIRNAMQAKHHMVEIPASNLKKAVTTLLHDQGYIQRYAFEDQPNRQGFIKIWLKYNPGTKKPVIAKLKRVSKPGLRKYVKASHLPHVLNGLGIAILSTPRGIITDKEARKQNVGGEVLCYVY